MKSPKRYWVLASLALAGVAVSLYQSWHFYAVRSGVAGFKSFCTIGESFNCDSIAASSYAEFLPGLPLSSFAAGWFFAMAVLAILATDAYRRRDVTRGLLILSTVALVFGLVYLAIMVLVLKTFCMLCLVVDGLSLASFGIVLSLRSELIGGKWNFFQMRSQLWILVGALGAGVVIGKMLDPMSGSGAQDGHELKVQAALATPPVPVATDTDDPSIGPKDAPITIVKFSDFKCPACKVGALTVHPLLSRMKGQVRFILRGFPLEASCNRGMPPGQGHGGSCEAAKAAICAEKQGKFEDVYHTLFENQEKIAPGRILSILEALDLDRDQLEACMAAPETEATLLRGIDEGLKLGIRATPTFYINGRKIEGALPFPAWVQISEKLK